MTIAILSALAVSIAQCGAPQAKSLPPDLASLVEVERAFASASVAQGMRAAFLHYLADDAVVFRPEPVQGKKWYRARPASTAILAWEPAFADVSASNDLGYTTGPWALRPDSTSDATAFGHYVSVWKRGTDREWKVAIDVGISHARVQRPKSLATASSEKSATVVTQPEALAAIQQEERDFVEAAARGIEDAFDTFGSEDVRVYREGDLPAMGKDQVRVMLAKVPGTRRMQTSAAAASRDGDLGFTYGRCDVTYDDQVATSYYLRIWKRMPDDTWKIVLDLESPVPAKE
jgi:ketosteroid isomerase-like protein